MILGTPTNWDNLMSIATKPDNIPILIMVVAVGIFTWLSLREAGRNDRLIKEGRKSEILRRMQD